MKKNTDSVQQTLNTFDPFGVINACSAIIEAWGKNPDKLQEHMEKFYISLFEIQQQVALRSMGRFMPDFVPPVSYDERFRDEAWVENPWFDFLKEYYLLFTRTIEDAIFDTRDVPDKTRRRAAFWTRQVLNAVSPSNFLWTNPAALNRFITTGGQSLAEGYKLWLQDIGNKDISMVEEDVYKLGKDIACTPGEVVYRNELLEVIQYAPATPETHTIPIVIIAPWINKYYILDMGPEKSLINFLVNNGYTVFITSWKNPTPEMSDVTFDDYLVKGALTIINIAREICDVPAVHAVGYCIGGTLLTALMAWTAQDKQTESPVSHWTLLTTLVDFSSPGDIDAFITEESVQWLEQKMEENGYLDGKDMGSSFRWLRPNSLIWRYVIQSYLYGESPPPLDVLQWNVDCTRLPKKMHSFYLRKFYLENCMIEPNALVIAGRPIDLGTIKAPLYSVGTEQDHIAPWKETFKIANIITAPVRYTLATSGHIIGILSPPVDPPKRRYWSGEANGVKDPEAWRNKLEKVTGSWWDNWIKWLDERCGPMVPSRAPGNEKYTPVTHAPGDYVLEK